MVAGVRGTEAQPGRKLKQLEKDNARLKKLAAGKELEVTATSGPAHSNCRASGPFPTRAISTRSPRRLPRARHRHVVVMGIEPMGQDEHRAQPGGVPRGTRRIPAPGSERGALWASLRADQGAVVEPGCVPLRRPQRPLVSTELLRYDVVLTAGSGHCRWLDRVRTICEPYELSCQ